VNHDGASRCGDAEQPAEAACRAAAADFGPGKCDAAATLKRNQTVAAEISQALERGMDD
jgi:hypothetical protein